LEIGDARQQTVWRLIQHPRPMESFAGECFAKIILYNSPILSSGLANHYIPKANIMSGTGDPSTNPDHEEVLQVRERRFHI
jgi:hypothetical protein